MKKVFTIAFSLFITLFNLNAQDEKAVFKIQPLAAEGSNPEEVRLLETLVYSYFSDKEDVIILPPDEDMVFSGVEADELSMPEPDYFVKISLYPENENCVFELIISDADSNELSRQTAKYKTTRDIALNMHNIVNMAFEWREDSDSPEAPDVELIIPEKIFGLWRGDTGIKLVRILPNGKAFAFFASGVNMMLSYNIENNTLNVKQVSPNNENFYYPLPLPIAKVLAREAEPMRWEFMLYENENLLKGNRIETTVEFEDYEKIVIRHNSVRKSEWNKLPR
ncbi:MAG: hypothetical protein LBC27_10290 [Spirochaetaceae bacterium]|jgi:hypothetical protein|nr:hypothetical protein [Spirochaetaceae bacterium]